MRATDESFRDLWVAELSRIIFELGAPLPPAGGGASPAPLFAPPPGPPPGALQANAAAQAAQAGGPAPTSAPEGYPPPRKEKKKKGSRKRDKHSKHPAPSVLHEGEAWEAARNDNGRWVYMAVGQDGADPAVLWQLAALRDDSGDSVLHAACLHGSVGFIDSLLSAAAAAIRGPPVAPGDPHAEYHHQQSEAYAAGVTTESLRDAAGADGTTPLQVAALCGHAACVERLLQGTDPVVANSMIHRRLGPGGDIGLGNRDPACAGATAIHLAAHSAVTSSPDALMLLLSAGGDAGARDARGRTCLHYALTPRAQLLGVRYVTLARLVRRMIRHPLRLIR